jgi:uncharacterized protein (DUF2147 family)
MRLAVFLLLLSNFCLAQVKVIGKWKTIDDNTSKEKSVVEITERSGKIYGKVIKIYTEPGKDPDPVCNKCEASDARRNKKIIGMEIIKDLVKDGEEYGEGTILDPENGKVYRCKIWVEGGSLMVRGYWGPFFRTQTWLKVP